MKKYLIAIAMVLALSMNANAVAQKHRHTPRTEQVDTTKNNPDAIEAFSDTTAVSSTSNTADKTNSKLSGMLAKMRKVFFMRYSVDWMIRLSLV